MVVMMVRMVVVMMMVLMMMMVMMMMMENDLQREELTLKACVELCQKAALQAFGQHLLDKT